jgi:hypothetical protein
MLNSGARFVSERLDVDTDVLPVRSDEQMNFRSLETGSTKLKLLYCVLPPPVNVVPSWSSAHRIW